MIDRNMSYESERKSNKGTIVATIIIIAVIISIIIGTIVLIAVINNKDNINGNDVEAIDTNSNKNKVSTVQNNVPIATPISTMSVIALNEIRGELSDNTISQYQNVKKDYFKSEDGKIEINISAFDMNIPKNKVYNVINIEDGVILFYRDIEKNYIEKYDLDGNSIWKLGTSSKYSFSRCFEVIDGYYMLGTTDENQLLITKMSKQGNMISAKTLPEDVSDIIFVESEDNAKSGNFEIIGINTEKNNIIIQYDKDGNQQEIINTKMKNIACKKIIKLGDNYYGIGAYKYSEYNMKNTVIFKLDSNGNELFNIDITKDETFRQYIENNGMVEDITVNNQKIYILTANETDVYALSLDGELKKKFGYNTNNILNGGNYMNIEHIIATNEAVYVCGPAVGQNIDKISNDFKFEYRINISNTKLFPRSTTVNAIKCSKIQKTTYMDADLYDESSILLYRHKFN